MRRLPSPPRPGWAGIVQSQGVTYWYNEAEDGSRTPYWDESARYSFTLAQIEAVEAATVELNRLVLAAVDRVVSDGLWERFRMGPAFCAAVAESWRRGDLSLYGRMDLAWDGTGHPKLLEFNADTPTSAVETAVAQWMWMEQLAAEGTLPEGCDQFNCMHEKLIDRFAEIAAGRPGEVFHFAAMPVEEDAMTVEYLRDCAAQAGLETCYVAMPDIRWNGASFADVSGAPIRNLFKLYPWEWLMADEFGAHVPGCGTSFIEPAWKAVASDKAILPLLWEMFPGHPNLLAASFDRLDVPAQVKKPIFGREGANVSIYGADGSVFERGGTYGAEGFVWQERARMWTDGARWAQIGSWLVGSEPAGMCVREGDGPVIDNRARFVPHYIEPCGEHP
jgi:glutathionylspermidine synthase